MWRRFTYYLNFSLTLLMLALPSLATEQGNLVVEINGFPTGYSARSAAIEPVLAMHPSLRLRSYKRLQFADQTDELSYSIKTGNAPDVMALTYTEYLARAHSGALLDLSKYLLRAKGADAAWSRSLDFGDNMLANLLVDGRIYAFPGRKKIHGVILRRDLLKEGDPIDDLTVMRVAQMAALIRTRMPAAKQRSGIAIPLTVDKFIYWAMADFGCSWIRLPQDAGSDGESRAGAAMAGLQNAYDSIQSMLYRSCANCRKCGAAAFAGDRAREDCVTCGGVMESGCRPGPVGRIVNSPEVGLDMFAKGEVGMVLCTRDDVLHLVDLGYPHSRMLFVPLAGLEVVPDVELFGLYSGLVERSDAQLRADELAAFLTTYTTQLLLPSDSPLYLWYERNAIEQIIRRGYAELYAPIERAACVGMAAGRPGAEGTVSDAAIQYSGVLPVVEFLEIAGVSLEDALKMTDGLKGGSNKGQGCLSALQREQAMSLSPRSGRVISLLLLSTMLAVLGAIFAAAGGGMRLRAYLEGAPLWVGLCAVPAVLVVSLRLGFLLISLALQLAGGVTGSSCLPELIGQPSELMLAALGQALFSVMVCVALGIAVTIALALLFARFKGWRVVMAFLLVIPVTMLGVWGSLLCSSVAGWLLGGAGWSAISADAGTSVLLRAIPAVWAVMPFACLAYVYRLRRIDNTLRDAVFLDGGSSVDSFFLITLPALEPVIKLHGLVLACIALCSTDAAVTCVNGTLGGKLLRSLLFNDAPFESMLLSGLLVVMLLTLALLGLRWIKAIEFRQVYGRPTL